MQIQKIINNVHIKFSQSTENLDHLSEEWLIYVRYADDAISTWEDCVCEGYRWHELRAKSTVTFSGSGSDAAPENFLCFADDVVRIGGTDYRVVAPAEMGQCDGVTSIIWMDGEHLRTCPAVAPGAHDFVYLRKATRYTTGTETAPIDMRNPKMIEHFVLARVYAANNDVSGYNIAMTDAAEALKTMKYQFLA